VKHCRCSTTAPGFTRPWHRLPRAVAGAALAAWLTGCATSADPHEGGFVSGVVGLVGGGYQQRVDQRQDAYQGELNSQQRLQAEARSVEQERAAVRTDLNRANARLAELERRIARQRAALRASAAQSAASRAEQQRLDQAQARVTRTKGALRSVNPNEQPVGDLKARSVAINQDLNQIDSLVGAVSGKGF
jgi:chromosome segregation ATPase